MTSNTHPLDHLRKLRCSGCGNVQDPITMKTHENNCLKCGSYIRIPLWQCDCGDVHREIHCPSCGTRRNDDDKIIGSYFENHL